MKYDDASWHYGGEFPPDLPVEAGATHAGIHIDDFPDDVPSLHARSVTPGQFFLNSCDGKFTDEDLNEEGNKFTQAYFDVQGGSFLADYERLLAGGLETLYHVPDTWETFDILRPVLDERFKEWRRDA